jgi:hypothetical protein
MYKDGTGIHSNMGAKSEEPCGVKRAERQE